MKFVDFDIALICQGFDGAFSGAAVFLVSVPAPVFTSKFQEAALIMPASNKGGASSHIKGEF